MAQEEQLLRNESLPIEMRQNTPEGKGRNFVIWAGNLAFNIYSRSQEQGGGIVFNDLTYINFRHLETFAEYAEKATALYEDRIIYHAANRGTELSRGSRVRVGRNDGIAVFDARGQEVRDALPVSASELVMLDPNVAAVHFKIAVPQPNLVLITDQSGSPGTLVQERERIGD